MGTCQVCAVDFLRSPSRLGCLDARQREVGLGFGKGVCLLHPCMKIRAWGVASLYTLGFPARAGIVSPNAKALFGRREGRTLPAITVSARAQKQKRNKKTSQVSSPPSTDGTSLSPSGSSNVDLRSAAEEFPEGTSEGSPSSGKDTEVVQTSAVKALSNAGAESSREMGDDQATFVNKSEQENTGNELAELRRETLGGSSYDPAMSGDFWKGVTEETKLIEWPSVPKVLGTTGVVVGVIFGSSLVLLTVNAILAELSDKIFSSDTIGEFVRTFLKNFA